MNPIYEYGGGHGVGYGMNSFLERFDSICRAHVAQGRASAFAFIFYDFTDHALRQILEGQGVFAKLDRLSGKDLSIFYLHQGSKSAVESFNEHFLAALGIQDKAALPCVVFFRVSGEAVTEVEVAELNSADMVHGLHELYGAISSYLSAQAITPQSSSKAVKWFRRSGTFLSLEALRAGLKAAFDLWF